MPDAKRPPQPAYWSRSRIKSALIQTIFLVGVGSVFWFLLSNTTQNLSQQGIASGFGFLSGRSGFDVSLSFIPFTSDSTYATAFWVAVINTLLLSALGIALATLLGFSLGLARVSSNWLIARLATVYIEVFRNIPLLLQLFVWYFAILRPLPSPRDSIGMADLVFANNRGLFLPGPVFEAGISWVIAALLAGLIVAIAMSRRARRIRVETSRAVHQWYWWVLAIVIVPALVWIMSGTSVALSVPELKGFNFKGGLHVLPEMLAALLGLSFYISAAVGEIVRAGIQGIERGQTEAAEALGHTRSQMMRFIIIPQALKIIIPPLTTQYQSLAKNTSLAAAIAFPEIISIVAGTVMTQTGQALETILLAMAFYVTVSLSIAAVMNFANYRVMKHSA